jgi:hypothetical protein
MRAIVASSLGRRTGEDLHYRFAGFVAGLAGTESKTDPYFKETR